MPTQANYTWLPSTARVVTLDGFATLPRGCIGTGINPLAWPPKDPGDTLDFVLDVSEAIAGNEGDAIATLDVIISPANPGDLAVRSASADGALAILWLEAGFAGTTYAVTVTIGTNGGRTIARTINLPVLALATPPVPPGTLTDQFGGPIVTNLNSPITTSP